MPSSPLKPFALPDFDDNSSGEDPVVGAYDVDAHEVPEANIRNPAKPSSRTAAQHR